MILILIKSGCCLKEIGDKDKDKDEDEDENKNKASYRT